MFALNENPTHDTMHTFDMYFPQQSVPDYLMGDGGYLVYIFIMGIMLMACTFYLGKQVRDFRAYLRNRKASIPAGDIPGVSAVHAQAVTASTASPLHTQPRIA